MLNKVSATMLALALCVSTSIHPVGATERQNEINSQTIKVFNDSKEVIFPDVKPYISDEGRTMVPIRALSEAFGAKVDWNNALEIVAITKGDMELKFKVGYITNDLMVKNLSTNKYKEVLMDSAPVIKYERTYVPLRFISEAFGYKIDWNPEKLMIDINTDETSEIFIKNPALFEELYVIENDTANHKIIKDGLGGTDEDFSLRKSFYEKAKSYLEDMGNVDFRSIPTDKSVQEMEYNTNSHEYLKIYNSAMKLDLKPLIYEEAIKNSIVREEEFISDPEKVRIEGAGGIAYSAFVTGKLRFAFHSPTTNEFLSGFRSRIELDKQYDTDVTVEYYRDKMLGWIPRNIVIGSNWNEVSNN